MTMNIDVGTVLRGTVCELYSNLVTRPTGAAVRSAIEQQVSEVHIPAVTTIDFSRVNLLDFSCADEIVAKLLLRWVSDDGPGGYLAFRGIHDGHLDPIETVLERHALALVSWHEGEAELFGHVNDLERSFWDVVRDNEPIGADGVARHLETTIEQAVLELDKLVRRRLLIRDDVGYHVPGAVWKSGEGIGGNI